MNIVNIMIFQIMPPRVILLSPNNIISIFLFGFANCVFAGQVRVLYNIQCIVYIIYIVSM